MLNIAFPRLAQIHKVEQFDKAPSPQLKYKGTYSGLLLTLRALPHPLYVNLLCAE